MATRFSPLAVSMAIFAATFAIGASAASAQTMHNSPKIDTSAAVAAAHLQAQGYSDIHDLHKNTDGTWTGQITLPQGLPPGDYSASVLSWDTDTNMAASDPA